MTVTQEDIIVFKTIVKCLSKDKDIDKARRYIAAKAEEMDSYKLSSIIETVKIYKEDVLITANVKSLEFLIKNIIAFKKLDVLAEYKNTPEDFSIAYNFYKTSIADINIDDIKNRFDIQTEAKDYVIDDSMDEDIGASFSPK